MSDMYVLYIGAILWWECVRLFFRTIFFYNEKLDDKICVLHSFLIINVAHLVHVTQK